MHLIKWSRLDLNQSKSVLALKGKKKKKCKNSSLLLEAEIQNSNHISKKMLILQVSRIEQPQLNSGSATFTWLGYAT